jgi:NAD(P) transhydrogenase
MHDAPYDLVVIGAGPAGQSAAELAATFGRRTIVVEHDRPGGVVTTTGGAPTKTLREAAVHLTGFGQHEVYGTGTALPLTEVMPIIRKRLAEVRDQLQDQVTDQLAERGIDYLRGTARLGPDRTVLVERPDGTVRELAAGTVLIATGSRPAHFPGIDFTDPDVYDSDRIYEISTAPGDMVVVGGGAVGVEYASVLTALGIPVTLVSGTDRLLPTMDGELAALVADELAARGVRLLLGVDVRQVGRVDGRLTVALSTGEDLGTGAVLVAAGRRPNTEGLGLAEAGVRLDERGRIDVDAYHRTSAEGIYAAGDVIGPTLASTSKQQGRAAAAHACGLVFGVSLDRVPSSAVYGLPEVAGVGLTEEQVQAAGTPYAVGRCELSATARGAIAGHGGRLKLIFRASDRTLLGVHCVGDIAAELVGLGHVVMRTGAGLELLLSLGLNTPTYSSAYHDAAVDGLARLSEVMGHGRRMPLPGRGPSVPPATR